MYFIPRNRKQTDVSKPHRVTVSRLHPDLLEQPVADLKKRGYIEVKRGTHCDEDVRTSFRKTAILTSNIGSRDKKTLEPNDCLKHYVVMERKVESVT